VLSVRREELSRPLVVLVHGLARTPASMWLLARRLEGAGFETLNWGYSSVGPSVAQIGARLAAAVRERRHQAPVHFVTHSLGGVVVRAALGRESLPGVGRVVMLAPPNRGSPLADCVAPYLGWLLKPLPDLTTHEASAARTLPVPRGVEIGIVAAASDGKVRLEDTHLPGETAHLVVRGGHALLIYRRAVQEQIISFLREGRFAQAVAR
jgi:pimeloyl-ACP methyl ester carboxylesterase